MTVIMVIVIDWFWPTSPWKVICYRCKWIFFTWLLINTLVISTKNWMVGQKNCDASTNVWSWLGHGFWGWLWGGAETPPLLPSPQPEESIRVVKNTRRGVLWESEAGKRENDRRVGKWQHLYQIVSWFVQVML